jgi:hypothetical protein
MIVDSKKKQTFYFESVHKRENFCQQIMHMKNKHSKGDHVDQISVFVGTWNMGKTVCHNKYYLPLIYTQYYVYHHVTSVIKAHFCSFLT